MCHTTRVFVWFDWRYWRYFLFSSVHYCIFKLRVNHHLKLPKIRPCEPQVVPRWIILPILNVRMWKLPLACGLWWKKQGESPYKDGCWALRATNSWLVFLNQKILYSLYFKSVYVMFFFTPTKTTEQRKGRISNCQNRLPFLAHQNEATQADHYECVLPAAWGLSDWKQLHPEMQEAHKGCLERKMTLKFWVNFAWRCVNFFHLIFKLWVGRCSLANGPTLLVDHFACWGNFPHW